MCPCSCRSIQEVTTKRQPKRSRGLGTVEHRIYHVKFAHLIGLESHDLQPTSLEEGEGADGTTPGATDSARIPLIGEFSLDYQIYQMVDSAGARGVSTVVRSVSRVVRGVSTVVRGVSRVVRGVSTVVRGVSRVVRGVSTVVKGVSTIVRGRVHSGEGVSTVVRVCPRYICHNLS